MKTITNIDTFLSESEYQEARAKHDAYANASREWMKANKTNGIPKEVYENFPFANEVTNEMRSKIEVWEFINNVPEQYFLYIDEKGKIATTWTGAKLGNVGFGKEYHSVFGDKRQSINVYAINGKTYYGIYYKSAGDYARIKLFKHQN